jgi:hypothetical protein
MADQASGQQQDGPHECEHCLHQRGHDPERNREEPEERPRQEKKDRKGPAEEEENGVQEQGDERFQRGDEGLLHQ